VLAIGTPKPCTSLGLTLRAACDGPGALVEAALVCWPAAVKRPPHCKWRAATGSAVIIECDAGQLCSTWLGRQFARQGQKTLKAGLLRQLRPDASGPLRAWPTPCGGGPPISRCSPTAGSGRSSQVHAESGAPLRSWLFECRPGALARICSAGAVGLLADPGDDALH